MVPLSGTIRQATPKGGEMRKEKEKEKFISHANNLRTVIWFEVFLSNTNNFQVDLS